VARSVVAEGLHSGGRVFGGKRGDEDLLFEVELVG
jgi:hypothetical protein